MYVNAATGIGNIQYDSNAIEADWSIIFLSYSPTSLKN